MSKVNNLIGRTFGRLLVVSQAESNKKGRAMWLCNCSCGNTKVILGDHLLRQDGKGVLSCNCLQKDNRLKHGAYLSDADLNYQIKFCLLQALKDRAHRKGYESDLELNDLPDIPSVCPALGVPLVLHRKWEGVGKGKGRNRHDNSPTIDRLNSNLPYLKKYKDNLYIISWRANKLKSDGTFEELEAIVEYMRNRGVHLERESSLIDSKSIDVTGDNEAQAVRQRERLSEKTLETNEAIV